MSTTWQIPSRVALLCAASLLAPLTGTAATALATAQVQGGASQRADLQSFDGVVALIKVGGQQWHARVTVQSKCQLR